MVVLTAKVPMLSGRLKISDPGSWRRPGALTLRAGASDGNCGLAEQKIAVPCCAEITVAEIRSTTRSWDMVSNIIKNNHPLVFLNHCDWN